MSRANLAALAHAAALLLFLAAAGANLAPVAERRAGVAGQGELARLAARGEVSLREGLFQTPLPDGRVRCDLCPRLCALAEGERGDCRARGRLEGKVRLLAYGRAAALAVDPVEKKPLYHFLPGTGILSYATAGCNLHCLFCQNWELSQGRPEEVGGETLPPEALADLAVARGCRSIACTYSEPVVFFEYALDTMRAAKLRGLRTAMVTALYANTAPIEMIAPLLDAATVDIKSFDDAFYAKHCGAPGAGKAPVLEALLILKRHGVHLELVKLVIPTLSDDEAESRAMFAWIAENLGRDTPIHLLRFFPQYQVRNLPPTPEATLERVRGWAREAGLVHVYLGNAGSGAETRCAGCGFALLERSGMRLVRNRLAAGGRCPECGAPLAGVFD